jgi:hypothetical protein
MFTRAVVIWCVLLVIASVNGAVRQSLLIPRVGDTAGRAISSVALSAAILLLTWFTIEWIGPRTSSQAWAAGVVWIALTLAFEFLAGHYVFGTPWISLLEDYNVLSGRIWILVLITIVVAPRVCFALRGSAAGG